MQTRSSSENQSVVSPAMAASQYLQQSAKAQRYQAMREALQSKAMKANEEAKIRKRREQKLLEKEQIKFQKQQLKSRCQSTSIMNFFGQYGESDEQIKTRIHSHLLTGRLQNQALRAFALEVIKKFTNISDLSATEHTSTSSTTTSYQQQVQMKIFGGNEEQFRVPQKVFKRAAKKATELMSLIPKSILKKRISDLEQANADLSLSRQIRALKRSERSRVLFEEYNCGFGGTSITSPGSPASALSQQQEQMHQFQANESHYLKKILQHPERDMEGMVRVIDQPIDQQNLSSQASGPQSPQLRKRKQDLIAKQSSLQSLDLATRQSNRQQTCPAKSGRRLIFNDTVEVYFYPENKEQHNHNNTDDDEDCDDLDSDFEDNSHSVQAAGNKAKSDPSKNAKEDSYDISFEELLFSYIQLQLLPSIKSSENSSISTPVKRARRSRANSYTPVKNSSFADYPCAEDAVAESDSDKSLSTSENTLPMAASSSGAAGAMLLPSLAPTTAVAADSQFLSPPVNKIKGRQYEISKQEITQITNGCFITAQPFATTIKQATSSMVTACNSASPSIYKQHQQATGLFKRQKMSPLYENSNEANPGCSIKKCLF